MVSFIFGGDTGETPESIKRKRDVVRALLGAQGAPRNIGEGLNALGDGIVANVLDRRADKAEKAGLDSANSAFSSLFSGGGGSDAAASPVPMTGAAKEVEAGSPSAASPDTAATEAYIRDAATKRGIDPDIAVKVARSEGLAPGVWQSNVVRKDGNRETSYGPFQLLVGGGLGDKFQKMYGKSPSDPSTLNQQIDFALDEAATGGWSPWYGAAKVGVGARTGLDRARALGMQPTQASAAPVAQEVASAEPMTASDAIAAQAPQLPTVQKPYVDPQVTTASRGPVKALTAPPQAAPALPPPTTVAPAPPVASVPQEVAQAAPQTPAQALSAGGPSMQQLIQASQNKFLSEGQRGVVNALLKQKMDQQEADRQLAIKRNDPSYLLGLEKDRLEVDNLKNPKISPADQARIDIEKNKLDFERSGISASDKAKNDLDKERLAFDRQKFDAEVKKGQWQKLTDGRLYNETTGDFRDAPPPLPGSTPAKFDDISGVRKEIQQLPSYKNLAQAAPIYKSMAETAGRNTKASDLNLVYGLGKIMDPTSVVREGEMVMVKNTASLPDWLQGAIASLNGGAALTPETRQAIMTEAFGRVTGYSDEFGRNIEQYKGIAKRNNMNPDDIIPPIDKFEPWKAPSPSATNIGADWQDLSPGVRIRKVN